MNSLIETFGLEAIFVVFGMLALAVVFAAGALSGKHRSRRYESERFDLFSELETIPPLRPLGKAQPNTASKSRGELSRVEQKVVEPNKIDSKAIDSGDLISSKYWLIDSGE